MKRTVIIQDDPCPALDVVICALTGEISYLCRGGAYDRHCYEDWQKPCNGSGIPTQGATWCPIPKRGESE